MININQKKYTKAEIVKLNIQAFPKWKQSIFLFLKNWFDENQKTISVSTSGSTGKPKNIEIPKNLMLKSVEMTGKFFDFKKGEKILLALSADYIAGKMILLRAIVWQMDLLIVEPKNNSLNEISTKEKIDFAAFVPLQLQTILDQNPSKLNQIKNAIIGGAAMDFDLIQKTQKLKTNIFATFGMTETISHFALQKINKKDKSSCFQLLPETEIKLDEKKCLLIKSPITGFKWLKTNDLVKIISPKEFQYLGRFDNVVNSGGIKIIVESIEKKIAQIIYQNENLNPLKNKRFFLAALPDEKLGEKLILIFEGHVPIEKTSILAFLKMYLPKYKNPKVIFFEEKFAETGSGKIDKKRTLEKIILQQNNV